MMGFDSVQKLMGKIFLNLSNGFSRLFWHDQYKHIISLWQTLLWSNINKNSGVLHLIAECVHHNENKDWEIDCLIIIIRCKMRRHLLDLTRCQGNQCDRSTVNNIETKNKKNYPQITIIIGENARWFATHNLRRCSDNL